MAVYYANFDLADGLNDGTSWANAIRTEAVWEAFIEGTGTPAIAAGDIAYVMQSTCTADSAWDCNANDGTATAPITIVGVKDGTTATPPAIADWSDTNLDTSATDDRPTFVMGANVFRTGDYWKVFNCKFTTTEASGINAYPYTIFYNCDAVNNSGTAARSAFYGGAQCCYIHCSSTSTNGNAFYANGTNMFLYNFAYNSSVGFKTGAAGVSVFLFNIIDTCATGIDIISTDANRLFGNSIYNSTTAVSSTDGIMTIAVNNIIHTATDGFKWTTQTDASFFAYNHNYCTDMYDGVEETVVPHKDNWVTGSSDPLFVDIVGDNYTDQNFGLQAGSPCINAGMAMKLAIGN